MNRTDQPATKKDVSNLGKGLRSEIKVLDKKVDSNYEKLDQKIDHVHSQLDQKIDDKFSKVLDGQDKIMYELQTIREEQIFQQAQVVRNTKRIERLEVNVGIEQREDF